EHENGATWLGEQSTQLTAALRRADRKRNQLAIQLRAAYQQAVGNRHAYPAVFHDVHGQIGLTRGGVAIYLQLIVDTSKCRVDAYRLRPGFRWISLGAKIAIVLHRNDHPP